MQTYQLGKALWGNSCNSGQAVIRWWVWDRSRWSVSVRELWTFHAAVPNQPHASILWLASEPDPSRLLWFALASLHARNAGWALLHLLEMAVVGLKDLVKYLLSKFHVAVHLPHSTLKRHHCRVSKTTTPRVISVIVATSTIHYSLLWIVWNNDW